METQETKQVVLAYLKQRKDEITVQIGELGGGISKTKKYQRYPRKKLGYSYQKRADEAKQCNQQNRSCWSAAIACKAQDGMRAGSIR